MTQALPLMTSEAPVTPSFFRKRARLVGSPVTIKPFLSLKPREVAVKSGLRTCEAVIPKEWPGVFRDSAERDIFPYQIPPGEAHVRISDLASFLDASRMKIVPYEYYLSYLATVLPSSGSGGDPLASGPIVEASSTIVNVRANLIARSVRIGRVLDMFSKDDFLPPGTRFLATPL